MQPGGPGWNDPPKLSYQVHSDTKTRRNLLNKRVAYLGNETKAAENTYSNALDSNKPPPIGSVHQGAVTQKDTAPDQPTVKVNFFTPNMGPTDAIVSPIVDDKAEDPVEIKCDEKFDTVLQLLMIMDKLEATLKKEVEKKINLFITMMRANELSDSVTNKMRELVFHLCNKHYQKAWDVHVGLTCDHIAEVGQWMPGVKRLINTLKDCDDPN